MPKLICCQCETELRPEYNGAIVAEMFQSNSKIYKLWNTDIWKCPICGIEIVGGFANLPFAEHFKDNCEDIVARAKSDGTPVIYDREIKG